jgi:hypothetical protein
MDQVLNKIKIQKMNIMPKQEKLCFYGLLLVTGEMTILETKQS